MELKDIKDKIEKAIIAVATANSKGEPHNIAVACVKVEDNKIIITNNYMKTTVENIKNNPKVSLVFWEGKEGNEEGWRIDGQVEYHEEGTWLEFVKGLKENKGLPARGALVVNIEKIRRLV
jgi:predicted pyridoxine 5'-phosphate oxidase superfamily flavin-nucleotide-binding protein